MSYIFVPADEKGVAYTIFENGTPLIAEVVTALLGTGVRDSFVQQQMEAHAIAVEHGWWEHERNDGEVIALMHQELSEALQAIRVGNPPDEHVPEFSSVEVELADLLIRVMDCSVMRKLRVWDALLAKMKYNRTRPHKRGGRAF